MTQAYELKLEKFTGPLDKLLELIEDKKLDVTEISLAQVTDDFLKYFKALTDLERDLHLVADFISIASKLILIKSKFLLPDLTLTPDEEAGIKDLEKRLKMYQELKPVLKIVGKLWQGAEREFGREYFLSKPSSRPGASFYTTLLLSKNSNEKAINSETSTMNPEKRSGVAAPDSLLGKGYVSGGEPPLIFYPGKGLYAQALFEAAKKLFDALRVEELETKTIKEKIISIEEKIGEVIKRIENELEMNFSKLSSKKSRGEVIVIFLAILHLAREQLIYLEQSEHFSDIIIKRQVTSDK